MMKNSAIVVVACVALFVSACGSTSQELIVGKWEAGEGGFKLTAEFTSDGKTKMTMMGQTLQGTYKLNGDELEWTMGGTTTKSKFKVTKSELEMIKDGKTVKYKRV
jgi:major membrane immunogen (membrane-anchored lipoprotein)